MKFKTKIVQVFLLFIIILLLFANFFSINVLSTSESSIQFKFEQHSLIDDFDSLNKTKINLKHNNIITDDYNGTYSFVNDTIGNVPIGWNNLSIGNANCFIQESFNNHNKILNLSVINADDGKIEQIFDDGIQIDGIIEFWFGSSDCTYINNVQIVSDATIGVFFRIYNDEFQYANGGWQTLDIIPIDNYWYHIKFDFNCITDTLDIYINDYYEGNYDFINLVNSFNRIWFENVDTAIYSSFFDAIGYSWSLNYTTNENKYPIIEIVDSNILSRDKYDFNLDSNNNPYAITGYPEIYGWNKVYSTESHIYLDMDNLENGVEILGELDGCGIKNESLGLYGSKFNITFELKFMSMYELDSYLNFTVISINNISIIELKFDTLTNEISNLSYFNGINYIDLVIISNINQNDIYSFNLYIYNYTVKLSWFKNNIYNNTYNFDLISNQYSINNISFLIYDDNTNEDYLSIRLNSIGIYQYNISLCRELGYVSIATERNWDLTVYGIFNFISNETVKIVAYGIIAYPENHYIIREFDNKDFRTDLHNIEKVIQNVNLFFITNYTFINYTNIFFSMNAIKMAEYIKDVFIKYYYPSFTYGNVDTDSYLYVDNYNNLHYILNIKQNDTVEYIWIKFDIDDVPADNRSVHFRGRQTTYNIGKSFVKIQYTDYTDDDFYLSTYFRSYSSLLKKGKTIKSFSLLITDYDDNNFTGFISTGYIRDVSIRILTDIKFTILTLYMIGIIISIILIFVPTLAIYYVYKKSQVIIPMITLMSIICFSTALIPFELFFLIMICMGCSAFLQYKITKD